MFIEKFKGSPSYEESTNNGVKTYKYGASKESFKVHKRINDIPSEPSDKPSLSRPGEKPEPTDSSRTPETSEQNKQTEPSYPTNKGETGKENKKKPKKPPSKCLS